MKKSFLKRIHFSQNYTFIIIKQIFVIVIKMTYSHILPSFPEEINQNEEKIYFFLMNWLTIDNIKL